MANLMPLPKMRFTDNNGNPLIGGKVFFFEAGTNTPKNTFNDSTGLIPNTNPVILDSRGEASIWLGGGYYKVQLKTSSDVVVWTQDKVSNLGEASNVLFLQAGTGAVARTSQDKMREALSARDYLVADGAADDSAKYVQLMNYASSVGAAVDFHDLTVRLVSSVSISTTGNVVIKGNGARIFYDGAHDEYMVRINVTGAHYVDIQGVTFDGAKLCNKPLEILNNTSLATAGCCNLTKTYGIRAKRSNVFSGGNGIFIRGAFHLVNLNQSGASDCELPSGQGTSGSAGINGIGITWYSTTSYVRRVVCNSIEVEKVYSSDLDYQDDQDGIIYNVPDSGGVGKVDSSIVFMGATKFKNCYGRSIKTQCQMTVIDYAEFDRDEGLNSLSGNDEIDAQAGSLIISAGVMRYTNGFQPKSVCNTGSDPTLGTPSGSVKSCEVYLDAATTLQSFYSNFPRNGAHSQHVIDDIKIFGKVIEPISLRCNGPRNDLAVSRFYVNDVQDGVTSEKALVYVRTSGAITPYSANVTITDCVNANAAPIAYVRDGIPGVGMTALVSVNGFNRGFLTTVNGVSTSVGLKSKPLTRMYRMAGLSGEGSFGTQSRAVAAGATETFEVNHSLAAMVFVTIGQNQNSYAVIHAGSATNVVISKGSSVEVGNAADPGAGTYRIWSPSSTTIAVQNNDASARRVVIGAFEVI